MMRITGLVPARFLTIISHLIAVIIILFSRKDNVESCLPEHYTADEYAYKDTQLVVGLSISLGMFVFELISFMTGVSMFMHFQCLFSTCAHCGATVALSYFLFEAWPCDDFWYIFGFCSCLPTISEIFTVIMVMCRG